MKVVRYKDSIFYYVPCTYRGRDIVRTPSSSQARAKSKTRKKITNSIGEEVEDEDIEKYRYERNWDASKKAYSYLDRKMGGSSWTVPADLNEKFVSWRDSVSYFFVV